MTARKVSAILLAAGFSSRMGELKALLPWKGKTLIEYQIEQLLEVGLAEIIVVLGYRAEELQKRISAYDVITVLNENYPNGKSTSIQKGVSCVADDIDGILVSAVDQPVSSETLRILIRAFHQTKRKVLIPVYQEKRGHPVLFSVSVKRDLMKVNEESKGLRNVIQKYHDAIEHIPVNEPHVLLNLNNLDDYLVGTSLDQQWKT
ncbi:nucleotidyltransferase family protein [Oceanobacillus luteolus]|uniref:nucleotidyltransferase family protein n=1 Tax=Oceanobacillus luteolus TaxID=1274358 RepID=UPI00203BE9C1|nr:nucleotidyltransferase family protein [Oceanobacillus luteolus]MCM3739709.1 nucleotidyltransferase family protein [Oceanobacillus luteolus]